MINPFTMIDQVHCLLALSTIVSEIGASGKKK